MTESVQAWLLDWPGCPLALAPTELVEVVAEPEVHAVPFGPSWCSAVLHWRDRLLPLALPRDWRADVRAVVVAYVPERGGAVDYAAIAERGYPRRIEVTAGADCPPPDDLPFEDGHVLASFRHEDRTVVVPDLSAMFGKARSASATSGAGRAALETE